MAAKCALLLLALMLPAAQAQPGSGVFHMLITKFSDAECTTPEGAIITTAEAFANLVSADSSQDPTCFPAGSPDASPMSIAKGAAASECAVKTYEHSCTTAVTYDGTLSEECMELPDELGYAVIGCIQPGSNTVAEDKTGGTVSDGSEAIRTLLQPPVESSKVVGKLETTGSKEDFDYAAWKAALSETFQVPARNITLIVSDLPQTRRRLLDGTLYVEFTVKTKDVNKADSITEQINDDTGAVTEQLAEELEAQGVDAGDLEVTEAATAEGLCTNVCRPPSHRSTLSHEFWARLKLGEEPEVQPMGPALFGMPRKAPTNNMENYDGQFDLTNLDYLSSTFFMGIIGYVMAILSLLAIVVGFAWAILTKICGCCCKCCKKDRPFKELTGFKRFMPMFFMLAFTGLACLGAFLIYGGAPKLTKGMDSLMDVITDEVHVLLDSADKIVLAFNIAAQNLDALEFLYVQADSLDNASTTVKELIENNKDEIRAFIQQANLSFLILACAFLAVAVLCTVFSECGWGALLTIFKHIAHLMTAVAWVLFGISMTTAVVMSDLCMSMEDYLEDPATSSLDALMPCLDPDVAVAVMNESRSGLVEALEAIQGPGTAFGSIVGLNKQLFGNMLLLCEPFMPSTVGAVCATPEREYQVYEEQLCQAFFQGTFSRFDEAFPITPCDECCTPLFRFEETYNGLGVDGDAWDLAVAGVAAADALRVVQPDIEDVLACKFVTSAFYNMVHGKTCKKLNAGLQLFTVGMALIGAGYTLLWITWNIAGKHIDARSKHKKEMRAQAKQGLAQAKQVQMTQPQMTKP